MLRHSTRLLIKNQRILHLRTFSNQGESKAFSEDNKIAATKHVNIQEKIVNLSNTALTRYNDIVGFTEIEQAYIQVTTLQESLHAIQSERTLVQLKISNIRSELTNLQTDLQEHRRGEPKYLTLMKKEFEVTQEKNKLEEHYEILDKKEREMFSHLQSKINMLHDKSRTHTRQWGIISTVIGAVLGIVGTSISAYFRNNDIRNIQKSMQEQFQLQVDQITKEMQQVNEGYNAVIASMERFEVMLKSQRSKVEKPRSSESWTGFFRRKSVSVWRWCTFQNSS